MPTVQQAQQALRKLVQATQDQENGIEPQEAIQLQRLVKMLRMSSKRELQQIQQEAQQHQDQQQKVKHIFVDALAICGTRNCVKELAEQIEKQVNFDFAHMLPIPPFAGSFSSQSRAKPCLIDQLASPI